MKRVVVRVYKVLQHIYIGVCVVVCEIAPHFTLQGGIKAFGQRAFDITVLSCEECDASFFIRFWEFLFRNSLPLSVWMYKGAHSFIIALKASVTSFPCLDLIASAKANLEKTSIQTMM